MPLISVAFIRTALLHLVVGFTLGALILVQKGTSVLPAAWRLLPAHIEILVFGWTVQLIVGTAFWILPRHAKAQKRGNEGLVWLAYGLLNAGILLAVFSPLLPGSGWVLLTGRLAEALGLGAFAANAWPRVKSFGK